MPSRQRKKSSEKKSGEEAETPSVITAAGLLAFYEAEEAAFHITPATVIIISMLFIAFVIGVKALLGL